LAASNTEKHEIAYVKLVKATSVERFKATKKACKCCQMSTSLIVYGDLRRRKNSQAILGCLEINERQTFKPEVRLQMSMALVNIYGIRWAMNESKEEACLLLVNNKL
jgi:hypothetical protein